MNSDLLLAALAAIVSPVPAGADAAHEVQYGPAPDWVLAEPRSATPAQTSDAAFRIVYQDTELRVSGSTTDLFSSYRVKILKSEGLQFGNINLSWNPSAGPANVHYVRIVRDGTVIDALKQTKFRTIERETGLEQSMLDGNLTAVLQVPGLQVGDELEFAATIAQAQPVFGAHNAGMTQLPIAGLPGVFRYRLVWPAGQPIKWRMTPDLPQVKPVVQGRVNVLEVELTDPPIAPENDGAPPRYNVRRLVEFSDYSSWGDFSKQMWPVFERASLLQPNSPIHAVVAKIAAAHPDPLGRAEAALTVVQDQVRYVYVGLNGGNYVSASADETWQRRFGDCKAKTALLLALLRELGVAADPVLVNSKSGNGTDERLPDPELFDHALVRAIIAGKPYWLDGTLSGAHHLDLIAQPEFEWALPLRPAGAELINVPPIITPFPEDTNVVDIDATAGFAKDATWTVKHVLRGQVAAQIETALSTLSPADAETGLKKYFRHELDTVQPDKVGWSYDDRQQALVLSLTGTGPVDWTGDSKEGHSLTLPGAGFYAPDKLQRPKEQNQKASWAVAYPVFHCFATTVHLPPASTGLHWTYESKPVNRRLAGSIYWRAAGMAGHVMRTVMSRQAYAREVPAADAAAVNAEIPKFDNLMSTVSETSSDDAPQQSVLPFTQEPDWVRNPAICSPPAK